MNAEDLAELLMTYGKVDLLMRPGNDINKILSIRYQDSTGQLQFTNWCGNNILPQSQIKLTPDRVEGIFRDLLDQYFVIDPQNGGGVELSKTQEKVGKKLTATQLNKLAACLPLAVKAKGSKEQQPKCVTRPTLRDVKEILQLGVSSNYEFQPEFYDKKKKKMAKKAKRSILQYALEQKQYLMAKLLLEHQADPNYIFVDSKKNKQSLLMRMTSLGNTKAVKLLEEYSAKYMPADTKYLTQQLLLTIKDATKTPMTLDEIKDLLQTGFSSNYTFNPEFYDQKKKKVVKKSKRSILQYALEHNKLAIAKLLLEHQADPNYIFTDSKGVEVSLLHRIIGLHRPKMAESVELLIKHGANINSQTAPNQMTPLHMLLSPVYNKTATDIRNTTKLVKFILQQKDPSPDLFLKNKIVIGDTTIESTVVQSAHHLVKKMDAKMKKHGEKLVKLIDDYVSKLSVVERLIQ